MKELARKGNISIFRDEQANDYLIYYDDIIVIHNALDLEELSDLKDCMSQVTAKKWILNTEETIVRWCPSCRVLYEVPYNFCPNCGLKLEGVEE